MEIDPANPRWYERFKTLTKISGIVPTPLDSGGTQIVQDPLGRMAQLAAQPRGAEPHWQAYPLSVAKPGTPHRLEIDYPADLPQTLGISIVEPNAAGTIGPIGLDSGLLRSRRRRPRRIALGQAQPDVLAPNHRARAAAHQSAGVDPRDVWQDSTVRRPGAFAARFSPRRCAAGTLDGRVSRPAFVRGEFFRFRIARSVYRPESDRLADVFRRGDAAAEYLNSVGYNGLMLSVYSEGSTIYPSPLLQPTPRFDTGAFFDRGAGSAAQGRARIGPAAVRPARIEADSRACNSPRRFPRWKRSSERAARTVSASN